MALTVTPGKTFAVGERVTNAKLNQLGQPIVEIEDGTIPEDWLDADLVTRLTPPKNLLINPDMEIWPKADYLAYAYSHSLVLAGSRKHDYAGIARWVTPNVNATRVVTREAFPVAQTAVPDYPLFYLRYIQNVALSGINPGYFGQRVENVSSLGSTTLTFSIWVRASAALTVTPQCRQNFGPDNPPASVDYSADVLTAGTAVTLVGDTWTKIEETFEVPSVSGKTIAPNLRTGAVEEVGSFTEFRIVVPQGVTFQIDFAHAMLNHGTISAHWERRSRIEEAYLCERYYQILAMKVSSSFSTTVPFINPRQHMPFLGVGWTGTGVLPEAIVGGGTGAVWALSAAPSQFIYQSVVHNNATAYADLLLNGEIHATD